MNCEQEYCIYNNNGDCILQNISINSLGMCDDCMTITLDKKLLTKFKERELREIESRWQEFIG